ncbi:MAG: diphthine--ammonia ligase [Anaerolineales bacterium]|nr:diphthine--ammonia ligase [Anaerolineales bacterium]
MISIDGHFFFCSWSGGKDSCLALYHAIHNRGKPEYLFTMMTEDGQRSRSHGLHLSMIQEQSRLLGIPLRTAASSWENYEGTFVTKSTEFKELGIEYAVFGDIDINEHRRWCEKVCSSAELQPYHPLWKRARQELLYEFIELGFEATIISIKEGKLSRDFLGKKITRKLIQDLNRLGIDVSGEAGEYHTVVTGGPIFSSSIDIILGNQVLRDGYSFLDVSFG